MIHNSAAVSSKSRNWKMECMINWSLGCLPNNFQGTLWKYALFHLHLSEVIISQYMVVFQVSSYFLITFNLSKWFTSYYIHHSHKFSIWKFPAQKCNIAKFILSKNTVSHWKCASTSRVHMWSFFFLLFVSSLSTSNLDYCVFLLLF